MPASVHIIPRAAGAARLRRSIVLGTPALLGAFGCMRAHASTFPIPGRPVRLVVPYVAGGGGDALARRLAPRLAERLGVPVVVENLPGGGTVIGALAVARAAPDGHTLFFNIPGFKVMLPFQTSKLPYDPENDFTPVTPVIKAALVLTAHPSVDAQDLHGLFGVARARPGQLAYASWGIGGGSHVLMELLKRRAGIDLLHIPYKGIAEIHPDLLQNRVQLVLDATIQGQHHVRSGALRALGIAGEFRVAGLPGIRTFTEQGVEGFDKALGGLSVFGPGGLPAAVSQRLYLELRAIVALPDIAQFMEDSGFRPFTQPPADFKAALAAQAAYWKPVIEELGIRIG